MVEVTAIPAAAGTGLMAYFKIFGVTLLVIIFAIVLMDSISESIQTHSIKPVVTEIGNRLILASDTLQKESQNIIDNGGIYDNSNGILKGIWSIILGFSSMFSAMCVYWAWIVILSKVFNNSPWNINPFSVWTLTFISFYILQVVSLLIFSSINHSVTGLTEGTYSIVYILMSPISSVVTFFKAIPYVVHPISGIAKKVEGVASTI